ncbi:MAG: metallophosphoesterase [candidate division Zixibacteria bacterium]|nr:metallophosphoesterase [candidate division Zixibacteria bacterium]MDH3938777.1 metallophosphoesterase [candidate division Zixibacteria bacterium]MDH4032932.1 metallophosphoesterase [candidate division Zixibacteria bacterium]
MSDIRYVCMSDLHFGEKGSLLTNLSQGGEPDPTQPSPVMEQLVTCLRTLLAGNQNQTTKPTLVLAGDVLELALTTTNNAAMVFERFIELVMPEDSNQQLFEKEIVFIPGNHDHHLWEMARESQYVEYVKSLKAGTKLPRPYHTTPLFTTPKVQSYFLTQLIRRHKPCKDVTVRAVYPNYALLSPDKDRAVVFTHGHFIESLYILMSTLKTRILPKRVKPKHIWDIEAENFAWIDFFWSTLGRSGEVGKDVEMVYKRIRTEKGLKRTLGDLAENLAEKDIHTILGNWAETKILKALFNFAADRFSSHERKQTTKPLSPGAEKGLAEYLEGPLPLQCESEKMKFPEDTAFIFGHTHKPFEAAMSFNGYNKPVSIFNTGGWVVDEVERRSVIGAAVVLLDDALNVASLRMYNESDNQTGTAVKVGAIKKEGQANPLDENIANCVKADEDPWREFSQRAAKAVSVRADLLKKEIEDDE